MERLRSAWNSLLSGGLGKPDFSQFLTQVSKEDEYRREQSDYRKELYCITLAEFHPVQGCAAQYQYPNGTLASPEIACGALPYGAHNEVQGFTCFTLRIEDTELYAAARFWTEENTVSRNAVPRSIALVARCPLYAFLLSALRAIVQDYTTAGQSLDECFEAAKGAILPATADYCTEGISVLDLSTWFQGDLLKLWKLLLMESRIVVYSASPSKVTAGVLSLLSLLPGQLCFGSAEFLTQGEAVAWAEFALPLQLFHSRYIFDPCVSLQRFEELRGGNYVVGCTNLLIAESKGHRAVVDLDSPEIRFSLEEESTAAELSPEETALADKVAGLRPIHTESAAGRAALITQIRSLFHTYIKSFLGTVALVIANPSTCEFLSGQSPEFLHRWSHCHSFRVWRSQYAPTVSRFSPWSPAVQFAIIHYENGDCYFGDMLKGVRHGKGRLLATALYEGQWANDLPDGEGEERRDGEVYSGTWRKGVREDWGTLTTTRGDVYKGYFAEGRFHGQGILTLANGNAYCGEFSQGQYLGTEAIEWF